MSMTLVIKPRMSEKAYGLSQKNDVYIFDVPCDTNKAEVARAIAEQFKVGVVRVNMANLKGKPKRTAHKGGRPTAGSRSDIKKAYVTLKKGDSIPIFATEEAESKPAKKKRAES